jgi:uncharacterized membrane protein YdjX (TVP38/TMEM64 family)
MFTIFLLREGLIKFMHTIKPVTIIKITSVLLITGFLFWFNWRYVNLGPEDIKTVFHGFGWAGPIVFVAVYIFRPLVLFPASILSLAGGLIFGPFLGMALIITGAAGGATLSFWIARKLGKNIAAKNWTGKAEKIQNQLEKNGFIYILSLRLIPVLNFDLISYLSGISKISFRHFLIGTVIGIVPATFAYSFLGSSFASGDMTVIIFALSLFVIISLVPLLLKKRVSHL